MWEQLSFDILARIFSFLPPDSLACAASSCKEWQKCAKLATRGGVTCSPPWFLAITTSNHHHCKSCYAFNPASHRWYSIPLHFTPHPFHPIAAIGSLILCRPLNSSLLQLALCNPFTSHYKPLPPSNISRTTPALAVIPSASNFRVILAGGMSVGSTGTGCTYETTIEMYDSQVGKWQNFGSMPIEFAVRLTVWTPNEGVYSMGVLYWITSARAYSIIGLVIDTGEWKQVNVPMAETLEFAALVPRKGKVMLIGGTTWGGACVWELRVGDEWVLIERVPDELSKMFMGCRASWCNTKCVGTDEVVYLYTHLGSAMLVWKEVKGNGGWEWLCIQNFGCIRGQRVPNLSIKGLLLQPDIRN